MDNYDDDEGDDYDAADEDEDESDGILRLWIQIETEVVPGINHATLEPAHDDESSLQVGSSTP